VGEFGRMKKHTHKLISTAKVSLFRTYLHTDYVYYTSEEMTTEAIIASGEVNSICRCDFQILQLHLFRQRDRDRGEVTNKQQKIEIKIFLLVFSKSLCRCMLLME
jgi:hypothetical protein